MSPTAAWQHYSIEFTDPATARQTAARELAPPLQDSVLRTELRSWWYLRKQPGWRLRCQSARPDTTLVDTVLADLVTRELVADWSRGIYEPETVAFGGPAGMDIAHALFHHDSHHLLSQPDPSHSSSSALGQRETTVLLFSQMLRAAGLDWFEQGDVWAKVAALRPACRPAGERADQLASAVNRLLTANPLAVPDLIPTTWCDAFATAGRQLAVLARTGQLHRGLRAVLAHHFLFQANRAGLSGPDQATLAALAVDTVFHATPTALAPPGASTPHP